MKKRMIISIMAVVITLASSITALAAPEIVLTDGGYIVFDSEYYAAVNADVAAVYGQDKTALLQHYLTCGIKEGRLPYAPGTDAEALLAPYRTSNSAAVSVISRQDKAEMLRNCLILGDPLYNPRDPRTWNLSVRTTSAPIMLALCPYAGIETQMKSSKQIKRVQTVRQENLIMGPYDVIYSQFKYDEQGRIAGFDEYRVRDDGSTVKMKRDHEFTYDSEGKIIRNTYEDKATWGGARTYICEYSYDSHGNLTREYYYFYDESPNQYTFNSDTEYIYDSSDRLIRINSYNSDRQMQWEHEYSYDAQNKLVRVDESLYFLGFEDRHYYEYSYNEQGQMTERIEYFYDDNNKLTKSSNGYQYYYDEQGRLAAVQCGVGAPITYAYDSDGDLIKARYEDFVY